LPNKIDLSRDAYQTVQGVYAGWAWLGIVDLAALIMNAGLAITLRQQRLTFSFAVTAALCIVVFSAIFFTWTFPANQATANWTAMPDDWSGLRREWECSHAASAVVMLIALCSGPSRQPAAFSCQPVLSTLSRQRSSPPAGSHALVRA
jgi:hypothetical protein